MLAKSHQHGAHPCFKTIADDLELPEGVNDTVYVIQRLAGPAGHKDTMISEHTGIRELTIVFQMG